MRNIKKNNNMETSEQGRTKAFEDGNFNKPAFTVFL